MMPLFTKSTLAHPWRTALAYISAEILITIALIKLGLVL